jgi:hypothetical protein
MNVDPAPVMSAARAEPATRHASIAAATTRAEKPLAGVALN